MGVGGKLCVLIFMLLVSASLVLGVGIGVNKGKLAFEEVLQNGYAEDYVLVTTESQTPITGTYEFEGDLAPWLRVDPPEQNFTFSNGNPHQIKVIIEPPEDARIQRYEGGLRVLTGELGRTTGGKIGTTTRAAFLVRIDLGMSGTERLECRMGGVRIRDTEVGQPSDLLASISNRGNVRIRPKFIVTVFDQLQENIVKKEEFSMEDDILPTATEEFFRQLALGLGEGQYWARVETPLCRGRSLVTFDVLAPGGIADKGELLSVAAKPWAKTGEIIPITATFKNLGQRSVNARFTGTVTTVDGGKLVKVIETEPVLVLMGQSAEIETFFNPTEPGQYIVAGRVHYNNKLTYQKSTIINVNGPSLGDGASFGGVFLLLLLIIIVILVLLIMIAKKRRKRRR